MACCATCGQQLPDSIGPLVHELGVYWREVCNHPAAKIDSARFTKIAARLKDGFTPDEIRRAIDGAGEFPYVTHGGRSRTGTPRERFDDIALVCRSAEYVERFMGLAVPAVAGPAMEKLIGD